MDPPPADDPGGGISTVADAGACSPVPGSLCTAVLELDGEALSGSGAEDPAVLEHGEADCDGDAGADSDPDLGAAPPLCRGLGSSHAAMLFPGSGQIK
jgi:hypothetical protein